jgi:hypothetical protein
MSTGDAGLQEGRALYEVVVRGPLSQRWVDWLGDMTVSAVVGTTQPETHLELGVTDQAALLGKLQKLHNLGLLLLQVKLSRLD